MYCGLIMHFFLRSLNEKNHVTATMKFMKADLHGCIITVQRSKCASYVGTTGIVLKESRNMFLIITADNRVKGISVLDLLLNI